MSESGLESQSQLSGFFRPLRQSVLSSRTALITFGETINIPPDSSVFLAPCSCHAVVLTVIYIKRTQVDVFMDLSYNIMSPIRM